MTGRFSAPPVNLLLNAAKKPRVNEVRVHAKSALGMIVPLPNMDTMKVELKQVEKAKVSRSKSPTSAIPLDDFCWSNTPMAKEVSCNVPIDTTRTMESVK